MAGSKIQKLPRHGTDYRVEFWNRTIHVEDYFTWGYANQFQYYERDFVGKWEMRLFMEMLQYLSYNNLNFMERIKAKKLCWRLFFLEICKSCTMWGTMWEMKLLIIAEILMYVCSLWSNESDDIIKPKNNQVEDYVYLEVCKSLTGWK